MSEAKTFKSKKLYDSLLKSTNNLIEKLPMIEKSMDKIDNIIDEWLNNGDFNKEESLRLYTEMVKNYHNSLELIRKIIVYFGPDFTPDEREWLKLYHEVPPERRLSVRRWVKGQTK